MLIQKKKKKKDITSQGQDRRAQRLQHMVNYGTSQLRAALTACFATIAKNPALEDTEVNPNVDRTQDNLNECAWWTGWMTEEIVSHLIARKVTYIAIDSITRRSC
jgi:hypothetical protein